MVQLLWLLLAAELDRLAVRLGCFLGFQILSLVLVFKLLLRLACSDSAALWSW